MGLIRAMALRIYEEVGVGMMKVGDKEQVEDACVVGV